MNERTPDWETELRPRIVALVHDRCSLRGLGVVLGVPKSTVGRWVNGESRPIAIHARRVAERLARMDASQVRREPGAE